MTDSATPTPTLIPPTLERAEATRVDVRLCQAIEAGTLPKELLISGPAGTGKTRGILSVLHCLARDYPNLRILIARATRKSLTESTLVTWEQEVLTSDGCDHLAEGAQRRNRHSYRYDNGSEVVVAGLDRSPTAIRSSAWDVIYLNESIELAEETWQEASVRLDRPGRDRRFGWLIGDTNPGHPQHWLKARCDSGHTALWNTLHQANPAMWAGPRLGWTEAGKLYLARLAKLTGHRLLRLLKGLWVAAEGLVYDLWSDAIHLVDRFPIPPEWRRIRSIDFGFTNPFTCQWWAFDPDGRMILYRELYGTGRTVRAWADLIRTLSGEERYEATVADHDAEGRATLRELAIYSAAADKAVLPGIEAVQERLQVAEDGKPRILVFRDALANPPDPALKESHRPTRLAEEIPLYRWATGTETKAAKDEPVKLHDHAMDAMRYAVAYGSRLGHGVLM